jgi:hypothetical protein
MHPEVKAWTHTPWQNLWALDKLIFSRAMGYVCGPAGVPVPWAGAYIVRPCVNAFGMGRDAYIVQLAGLTTHLKPGTFWCEVFEGRHISVDYVRNFDGGYDPFLVVEGRRRAEDPLWRWSKWSRLPAEQAPEFPSVLRGLSPRPLVINVEFVGGRPIEAHFRRNTDFDHALSEYVPVWLGQTTDPPAGYRFILDPDGQRVGAFVK